MTKTTTTVNRAVDKIVLIALAILVVMLAMSIEHNYMYRMYFDSEIELLKARNEQLMKSSENTDRSMNMLTSSHESLSQQLNDLQQEIDSVQNNATKLVRESPELHLHNQAPMEFIISDYHEKKEANEEWNSSPFYTHNRGYKFRLNVFPNGNGRGRGSHLSVYGQLMRGEYDNELEWPFEGDIRVELLNWRADENHKLFTISFNGRTDPHSAYSSRLTDQETARAYGRPQFISLTDLLSTTNTEYLRDDYLKLRISAIVYSTPLLPLIPAWQDPLISTQSGAQFTISEYSKRKLFDNLYFRPLFTTGPQGYTLCLRVDANGYGDGKGSHLSIFAYIMKGQHDDHLQWPFTGTIIIELLNWLEDKEHCKITLTVDTNTEFVRVTEGKPFGNGRGYPQFISHSSLTSSTTNTQYLYQECVRVYKPYPTKPLFCH